MANFFDLMNEGFPDMGESIDAEVAETEQVEEVAEAEESSVGEETEVEESEQQETEDDSDEEISPEVLADVSFVERFNGIFGDVITEDLLRECDNDLTKAADKVVVQRASGMIERFVGTLGQKEQDVLNALFEGQTVDEAYGVTQAPKPIDANTLESDPELQKEVIRLSRKSKGMSDKDIDRLLKSIGEDELLDEANESMVEYNAHIQTIETAKKDKVTTRTNAEKERQKAIVDKSKERLKTVKDLVPNVSLKPQEYAALEESMFDSYNKITKEPEKYIPLIGLFDKLGFFDGNFKRLTEKAKSSAKKDLASLLNKTTQERQKGSNTSKGGHDIDDKALRAALNI